MKPGVPAYRRWLRWLTVAAIAVGAVSTLSYGSGAHLIVRYLDPPVGRWWNEHEYALMAGAASALGMLLAIRFGVRLIDDPAVRGRAAAISIIAGALILIPLAHLSGALGRLGWTGVGGFDTYAMNTIVDKVLIAGVYFLKIAGFGVLAGLAMFAAAAMAASSGAAPRREA
ncbi:MAG TPA: hypothetical protein VNF29_14345 [Candidatus Binataceae bacterium]|nr:hypothetical protein [Candidatus Binataceae bacterium]